MTATAVPESTAEGAEGGSGAGGLWRPVTAGVIAAFVGFASSFAVVLEGLTKVGASHAQAASGLMALCVAMGLCAIFLSLRSRLPISVAWSTPGAALLAGSAVPHGGFPVAVGAFLITAVLIVVSGLWRPLGRWVSAIPAPLANAMLAGILLPLCLAPAQAVRSDPAIGLAVVVTWAVVGSVRKLYAVPAAVVVAVVLIATTTHIAADSLGPMWPHPVAVAPHFTLAAAVGIALPLYVVTMASQNIPGIAVLGANGYHPRPGPLFGWTGAFSLASAPLGGHAVNLAAITAALCAGDEAGPDRRGRYRAAVAAGCVHILLGLAASAAVALVGAAPPHLIEAVAGLALLGALAGALSGAMADPGQREAAAVTVVVTVSGVTFFGVSGAFWGLLAGGALYGVRHWQSQRATGGEPAAGTAQQAAPDPGVPEQDRS
ncbi:benzoate/H(+) symporter BenE family transporter [Streptomyces sp. NBC_01198]|uniref:benzoate/H(+) symporter BenE family transporter n=1 Tax=Streptomyces sp. NBC_01198 TaxID=2903769 RepID=UPI002E0FF1BC|nr:benzoate/H(+) symporter BenE family transporter [Streptomyces sp. NBC_01198]